MSDGNVYTDQRFGWVMFTGDESPVSVPGVEPGAPLAVEYANGRRLRITGWLIPVTVERTDPLTGVARSGVIEAAPIPMVSAGGGSGFQDVRSEYAGRMAFRLVAVDGTEEAPAVERNPARAFQLEYRLNVPDDLSSLSADGAP